MSVIDPFPTLPANVLYSRYYKPVPTYDTVTYEQKFEDGGIAVNAVTDVPPQTWELELHGLQLFQTEPYLAHYASAVHNLNTFSFTEKDGTVQTGVRYSKCEITHEAHKSWIKMVKITLVKYPA